MARGRVLGSIIGNAAGEVVSSGFNAIKGLAGSIAGAARGLTNLENQKDVSAEQTKSSTTNNVIYVNFGMAGAAGRQRVAGGGTLPQPKVVKASGVNQNMPTDKLLNAAIKQLTSINSTLKKQLEFDKRVYDQAAAAEREAAVESSTNTFSGIKDRLSGLVDTQGAASRAKGLLSGKTLLAGLGLLGAGSLIVGSLDNSELEKLNKNIEQFKKDYKWLFDLSASIGTGVGVGGFFGYIVGGLRGIIPGMAIGAVVDYFGVKNSTGILAAGAAGYLGYSGIKSGMKAYGKLKAAGPKMAGLRASASYYDPISQRIKNDVTGKYTNTKGATGFLKSPRWQKFLNWLTKRGKRVLVNKIQQRIAIAVTSGAVASTGIGAAFGAIGFLLNLGFSLYLMYEIYEQWKSFTAEEDATRAGVGDADIAKELNSPDAVPAAISGAPAASAAQMKNVQQIPADVQKILAAIRTTESSGNYGENSYKKGSSASGAYQFLDSTWKEKAKIAGVGTEYPRAFMAPPEIQDAVAARYVQDILKMPEVNGDVSKVPLVWFTGNARGEISSKAQSVNAVTPAQHQAKFMNAYTGGKFAASSYSPTSGASTTMGGLAAGAMAFTEDTARLLGGVAGQLVGKTTLKSVSTPLPSGPDKSREIGQKSTELDTIIKFGDFKSKQKALSTPAAPSVALKAASPSGTISVIDPNWHGIGDPKNTLHKYLANFKMAS